MLLIREAMASRGCLLISFTRFARLPGICGGYCISVTVS